MRYVLILTGVLKTYRLTFESISSQHALFNAELARNRWSISSKTLREFVEHFGPKTEQLDIYSEDGRVTFVSYTEKIVQGSGLFQRSFSYSQSDMNIEILKQPLHTSVAIDTLEFGDFDVEDKLHIVISVKDFKTIVMHAGITKTTVSAAYSQPSKPMQLKYTEEVCQLSLF
jgi:cell cycle checkpoint control protein RAD9A